MADLEQKVQALRDELRSRIRVVLGAPESAGWHPQVKPSPELLTELRNLTAEVVKRAEAHSEDLPRTTESGLHVVDDW